MRLLSASSRKKPAAYQENERSGHRTVIILVYKNKYFREDVMAEHVMHKKETKKAPKKTLKEKRDDKKAKKKTKE